MNIESRQKASHQFESNDSGCCSVSSRKINKTINSEVILAVNSGIFYYTVIFDRVLSNVELVLGCSENFIVISGVSFLVAIMLGAIITGFIITDIEKKKIMHLPVILWYISGLILIVKPVSVPYVLIAKILAGLATGIVQPLFIIHSSELTTAKQRPLIMSAYSQCIVSGILCGAVFSMIHWVESDAILNYRILGIFIFLLTFISHVYLYATFIESPIFLLQKGKSTEAIEAMIKLRCTPFETEEIKQDIFKLNEMLDEDSKLSKSILNEGNFCPLLLTVCGKWIFVLSFCYPLNMFIINTMSLQFLNLMKTFPIFIAAPILSMIRLICAIVAGYLLPYIGAKTCIAISGIGTGLLSVLIGIFILTMKNDITGLGLLTFVCVTYSIVASFILVVPDVLCGEAFPLSKKTWSISFTIIIENILHVVMFASTYWFDLMLVEGELYFIYIINGVIILLLAMVLIWKLPETKALHIKEARAKFKDSL